MDIITTIKSMSYFLLAGLFEIGGGCPVWLWLREGKPLWYTVIDGVLLMLYGVVPTLLHAHFSRFYAAYGGVFIVLSILQGWRIDKIVPDAYDIIGGVVSFVGVGIIMYWPLPH